MFWDSDSSKKSKGDWPRNRLTSLIPLEGTQQFSIAVDMANSIAPIKGGVMGEGKEGMQAILSLYWRKVNMALCRMPNNYY